MLKIRFSTGIKDRLLQVRKTLGLTQKQFADAIGISQSNLSRLEKGEYAIHPSQIILLKNVFNVNPEWLLHCDDPMFLERSNNNNLIPVIADIPAGHFEEWIDSYAPGDDSDYIAVSDVRGNNLFAIRVKGQSMEPKLYKGDVLIIDPHKKFVSGIAIVRHRWDYQIRNVKKIRKDRWFLWPLNPDYESLEITPDNDTRLYVPIKVISMRDI